MGLKRLKNQKGQIVVEYTLLLVVVIGLATLVTDTIRSTGMLKNLVFEPFAKLDGMIQCGVWEPCGVLVKAKDKHSNAAARVLSLDPERGPR